MTETKALPPDAPAWAALSAKEPLVTARWQKMDPAPRPHGADGWCKGRYVVLSSFYPMIPTVPWGPRQTFEPVPVYHLAIFRRRSRNSGRPTELDVIMVLRDFDLVGAMEIPTKTTDDHRLFIKAAI